ncbi:hypothetical protein BC332_03813 [Capsicum chinense]|nr:hypothetical protein BC332_03813 [Capsicum chinense]
MKCSFNPWPGVPLDNTLYPNPIDPYRSVPQNPNPSYGQGHCLVFGYDHTNAASSKPTLVYYQDPNVVQLLRANDPYRLGEVAAVSLHGAEKLTSANVNSTLPVQPVRSGSWGRGQRKSKTQPVWCDVCKLECNSNTVLDKHKLGKRHTKSLEKLKGGRAITAPTSAVPDNPVVGLQKRPNQVNSANGKDEGEKAVELVKNLETKRQKVLEGGAATDKVHSCLPCNVVCNSEAVFKIHLTGKKHIVNITKQEKLAPASASLVPSEVSANTFTVSQEKPDVELNSGNGEDAMKEENLETKTRKVLEGGAATNEVRKCLVCKVVCNSETVFRLHLVGKKHIVNVAKQEKLAPASASLVPSEVSVNTFIGPQEKPHFVNSGIGQDAMKGENLETKKRKVLEGGAALNEVRNCLVCEVVCNSETVFRRHLAGKKHIANIKKQASGAGAATNEVCKCLVCEVVCNSETVFRLHLAGRKHIANMKKQASGAGAAPAN